MIIPSNISPLPSSQQHVCVAGGGLAEWITVLVDIIALLSAHNISIIIIDVEERSKLRIIGIHLWI